MIRFLRKLVRGEVTLPQPAYVGLVREGSITSVEAAGGAVMLALVPSAGPKRIWLSLPPEMARGLAWDLWKASRQAAVRVH